jgi:hypothetical protein
VKAPKNADSRLSQHSSRWIEAPAGQPVLSEMARMLIDELGTVWLLDPWLDFSNVDRSPGQALPNAFKLIRDGLDKAAYEICLGFVSFFALIVSTPGLRPNCCTVYEPVGSLYRP